MSSAPSALSPREIPKWIVGEAVFASCRVKTDKSLTLAARDAKIAGSAAAACYLSGFPTGVVAFSSLMGILEGRSDTTTVVMAAIGSALAVAWTATAVVGLWHGERRVWRRKEADRSIEALCDCIVQENVTDKELVKTALDHVEDDFVRLAAFHALDDRFARARVCADTSPNPPILNKEAMLEKSRSNLLLALERKAQERKNSNESIFSSDAHRWDRMGARRRSKP